jgi:hypothetical protein
MRRHFISFNYLEWEIIQKRYREFAQKFLKDSPKECFQMVRDARDGLFTIFFFSFLSGNSPDMFIIAGYAMPYTQKLKVLKSKFSKNYCKRVLKSFWLLPFENGNHTVFNERIDALQTFLEILKQFNSYRMNIAAQFPCSFYETAKFILKEFEFTDDLVPSYTGLLKTFNSLCSLSSASKGIWKDDPKAYNLIRLFQFYSHHFSNYEFKNIPEIVPEVLHFMIIEQPFYSVVDIFQIFSFKSLGHRWFCPIGPVRPILEKVFPLFAAQIVKNKAPGYQFEIENLRSDFLTIVSSKELFSLGGFAPFLTSLNNFGPQYLVELGKGNAKIDTNLTDRE